MMTLYGKEIPEPDGKFADYKLPKKISDDIDSMYLIKWNRPVTNTFRWKKKDDMEKVVSIYNEFNGISQ